jgi:nicotinamide mononucleotide adenylyltransferase
MICPHIPVEERMEYECSDRVLVAANIFRDYKLGIWQSRLIHITNKNEESVAGFIHNVHPESDIVYIPSWMYRLLNVVTDVEITELKTVECGRIVFEPSTREFNNTENWKEQLIDHISNFTTLIPNSQIYIPLNGNMYSIRIVELFPKSDCVAYKIKKNAICDVFITTPTINYEDDIPDIPFLVFPRRKKRTVLPFTGRGCVLGGPMSPKDRLPAQMSYAAVLRRLGRRR